MARQKLEEKIKRIERMEEEKKKARQKVDYDRGESFYIYKNFEKKYGTVNYERTAYRRVNPPNVKTYMVEFENSNKNDWNEQHNANSRNMYY